MKLLPKKRTLGLIVEWLDDELLVYDEMTHQAHRLSALAARVWDACAVLGSEGELWTRLQENGGAVDPGAVESILGQLEAAGLLVSHGPDTATYTRRRLLASMCAVGAVVSVSAPVAAQVGSCVGEGFLCSPGMCCGGLVCVGGLCVVL